MAIDLLQQVTSTPTPTEVSSVLSFDWTVVALTVAAFVACLLCIYAVFFYGRQLQANVFNRPSLVEALAQQEIDARIRELDDRAGWQEIDYKKNPLKGDAARYRVADFWTNKNEVLSYDPVKDTFRRPDGIPDDEADYLKDEQEKTKKAKIAFKAWGEKENELYEEEKQKIKDQAREKANSRIPQAMDISLLGGGFSFLLEFSTVIVIIFAVVILSIIGILKNQEIATILAAIAGYVLGKATGFLPSYREQAQSEQPKVEDQSKKIEEQGKQIADQGKEIEELKKAKTEPPQVPPEDQSSKIKAQEKTIKEQAEAYKKIKKEFDELKKLIPQSPPEEVEKED